MSLSYLHTPDFLFQTLTVISVIALPIHILGAYCILAKTPKIMNSVKWIMLNLHFWSVLLDWGITFFTKPFVLFPAMAGVALGVLSDLGVGTGEQIYLVVTLFCIVCAAIVSIFENRYYLSFGKNSCWRHFRIPCMLFNYFLAFLIFLPAYLNAPDQATGLQKLHENLPELPERIRRMPIYVVAIDFSLVIGSVVLMGVLIVAEALAFVVLIFLGASKALRERTVSINCVIIQKKFLRALYIQILMILLNMGVPLFYLGVAVPLHYYNQAANNITFIIYSLHGVSSTIVMIWLHKPYRAVIQNIFCRRLSNVGTDRRKSMFEGKTTTNMPSTVNIRIQYNVNILNVVV
ncbi:Protein CBG01158 [Caenorhabditis briggsae]|uniref:Protein CBG01158 n=1 Tax=Caenorhabditis briggsae TaxID=6238 RepID=A8WPQ0_CAEBR|nr:Protein CBG01158 [Caenorhabditis briggsae]CAP22457.1 Protein CBG01158 [Caenorhabditis briggsae]